MTSDVASDRGHLRQVRGGRGDHATAATLRSIRTLVGALAACLVVAMPCRDGQAQSYRVSPYLQRVTPVSAAIHWETSSGDETQVDWGLSAALGSTTLGQASAGPAGSRHHTVALSGLASATRYYYRTVTGNAVSPIVEFITPATAAAEASFNLVAMSDMQKDTLNPNKFQEIVQDGVLPFVSAEYGSDLPSALSMVLVAGDLVDDGWVYDQFATDFFAPAAPLFGQVPVYPVLGNHERDSPYFFDYFELPDNGSPGYAEHWWYLDHGNLRVIGLDSNVDYRLDVQLNWLQQVLDDACIQPDIDFVFAELHHPYLSELWVEGEIDFTGEVIGRLEAFSSQCEKPSIHFFGHTHGYSRGQSRDHRHLWVNVATAGGNIDYWGEYLQNDYEQYTVTQDDWGFVMVELRAGDDPQFRLRRISRGNEQIARDNELRDDILIRRYNGAPLAPAAVSAQQLTPAGAVELRASDFVDVDDDGLAASHWQLATSCDDFSAPVDQLFVQHGNQYQGVDTQAGLDLSRVTVELPLAGSYCWRVRYRDQGLSYSDWSEPMPLHSDGDELDEAASCSCRLAAPARPLHPGHAAMVMVAGAAAVSRRRRRSASEQPRGVA